MSGSADSIPVPEIPPAPLDEPAFRVWWHFLRPERLQIARELDRAARSYDKAGLHEGAAALRDMTRAIRASAAAFGDPDYDLTSGGSHSSLTDTK